MYAALDEQGSLIYAKEAQVNQQYYCCHCDQQVKLILTASRRYFRHTNKTDNNINERLIHLKGKQLILTELQKYNFKSLESEYYLAPIQQRPDILLNRHTVIEYQCARLSGDILSKRVAGYRKLGLENIWILGETYLETSLRREHLKFIAYNKRFGYYVLMLDSLNQRLTLFHHVKFLGPFNKIFFQREVFESDKLPDLFTFQPRDYHLKAQVMNGYLLRKLRQKNDSISQKVKLDFYQQNKQTVEEYLTDYLFQPQAPLYQTSMWQIACGSEISFLQQPLLNKMLLKKPPQL